eukprot:4834532-Prymnesium_polylepis.1
MPACWHKLHGLRGALPGSVYSKYAAAAAHSATCGIHGDVFLSLEVSRCSTWRAPTRIATPKTATCIAHATEVIGCRA